MTALLFRPVVRVLLIVAALLTLPWVAMRFTDEVAWTASDFAAGGALLLGTGLLLELVLWKIRSLAYRAVFAAALLGALAVIWVHLAAGIF